MAQKGGPVKAMGKQLVGGFKSPKKTPSGVGSTSFNDAPKNAKRK